MTHATVNDTLISRQMDENDNIFTTYPSEVGRCASLEHDWDKDLVDVHIGFATYDLQKCFTLECDQIINTVCTNVGEPTLSIIGEETRPEASKWMLQGTEELSLSSKGSSDKVGQHVTWKRQYKAPRRYIHESLEPKSNIKRSRCDHKRIEGSAAAPEQDEDIDDSFVPCIQVPFGLPLEEEHVKEKNTSSTWSIVPCHDSDDSPSNQPTISNERYDTSECLSTKLLEDDEFIDESDMMVHNNNIQTGHIRRKQHVMWTQTEVMKLIEGVSKLGVGRWSKIKKLMFSSSNHRTPVDLKDKWRNLVKASSCTGVKKKEKVGKQLSHQAQAPGPVLLRVRELAKFSS